MRPTQPLPLTNPEFSVIDSPNFREYKIENWHLARDGSRKVIKGAHGLTWTSAAVIAFLSLAWRKCSESPWTLACLILFLGHLVRSKCTQVLFESVVVIAPHGIQLETHRGFPPSTVLSVSRRFIPAASLDDFVINEGLRRWSVRYYLVAIQKMGSNEHVLQVAYENILPHFSVLLEVYRGVQQSFFSHQ